MAPETFDLSSVQSDMCQKIAHKNFIHLPQPAVEALLDVSKDAWQGFQESWNELEQDTYMKDGGTYRYRRHATYSAAPFGSLVLEPAQPHYQTLDYNPLNGGIARYFAHIEDSTLHNIAFQATLDLCANLFKSMAPFYAWHIEVHQFRIFAQPQGASPTPEGVHRDGVDFVLMMLVNRINVQGGKSQIFDLNGQPITEFTLARPMEAAIVNDHHVMHGVTPIVQEDELSLGYRDVLVVTFRKK